MQDDDQSPRPASGNRAAPTDVESRPGRASRRPTLELTALGIAALLAIGVVVAALDMKYEADQARWQQRQTCLEWYRLQAEYGLGPWYEKLPAAAADCGGGETDDGRPTVPGGSRPALTEADIPAAGPGSTNVRTPTTTTTASTTTTTARPTPR